LLAHGRWFSPGTPASSTTKTGRHDIAESGVKTQKKSIKNQIETLESQIIKGFGRKKTIPVISHK
jgi:hypothetical protein